MPHIVSQQLFRAIFSDNKNKINKMIQEIEKFTPPEKLTQKIDFFGELSTCQKKKTCNFKILIDLASDINPDLADNKHIISGINEICK